MMRLTSSGPGETRRLAKKVILLALGRKARPVILALSGELGSGKTVFIQGLARSLGLREKIQSSTFVLMKCYLLPKTPRPFRHLVHVDAYRLESLREARHLGLPAVFADRDAIIAVEWADRIRKLIPKQATWLRFQNAGRRTRTITL